MPKIHIRIMLHLSWIINGKKGSKGLSCSFHIVGSNVIVRALDRILKKWYPPMEKFRAASQRFFLLIQLRLTYILFGHEGVVFENPYSLRVAPELVTLTIGDMRLDISRFDVVVQKIAHRDLSNKYLL
jgi:hypothetical protein